MTISIEITPQCFSCFRWMLLFRNILLRPAAVPLKELLEVTTVEVLHDEAVRSIQRADAQQPSDVDVTQARHGVCLAMKAAPE